MIHSVDKKIHVAFNEQLVKYDLTLQQTLVILYIEKYKDRDVYQIDIEKYLDLKNPSVTSLIKNLMKKDLVYREQDEKDGRYFKLKLTDKSMEMVDNLAEIIPSVNDRIQNIFTSEELIVFLRLLSKIDSSL